MLESIKPPLRAVKYGFLRWRAGRRADGATPGDRVEAPAPVAFLIGCGRSGTTVLGEVLAAHPDVCYLFEPYHDWAAVDPSTDCINLYHRVDGRCLMDATHATPDASARFGRLMLGALRRSGRRLLVEKTPLNTMRLEYLDTLAPGARYVHIVRDGVDVCRSIDRLSQSNAYRISGRPDMHQWWGVGDAKWTALARDGRAAGYWPDEVDRLAGHLAKGAYEWLVSLREVDRVRDTLGERLLEIRYPELTADPEALLGRIATLLGLPAPDAWLEQARRILGPVRRHEDAAIKLPSGMAESFNEYQHRYGFSGRAESSPGAGQSQ